MGTDERPRHRRWPDPTDTTGENVQIKSIGVIGVGTMGAGIMQVAATTGLEVVGIERNEADVEAARRRLEAGFAKTAARGKITEAQAAEALSRVTISTELDAVARTDLVVDAVFEDVALKCELLAEIDKLVPAETMIASNTSTIPLVILAGDRKSGRDGKGGQRV